MRSVKQNIAPVEIFSHVVELPSMALPPSLSPHVLGSNLMIPFLVATAEDYFQSVMRVLIRHSDRRLEVLKGFRIPGDELIDAEGNTIPVEHAIAKKFTLQDIRKVSQYFKSVVQDLDIMAPLRVPLPMRDETLEQTLLRIVDQRHKLVHRAFIDDTYSVANMRRDTILIKMAIRRVHRKIETYFEWEHRTFY